jgi:predicted nucleic acid-binding protein
MPVIVSPLAEYEVRKHLCGLAEEVKTGAENRLVTYLSAWEPVLTVWDQAIESALMIASEFRERLAVDSADTLHVAWAELEQCTTFASFDSCKRRESIGLRSRFEGLARNDRDRFSSACPIKAAWLKLHLSTAQIH